MTELRGLPRRGCLFLRNNEGQEQSVRSNAVPPRQDPGGFRYANEQNIVIGRILGIVFTILMIAALVLTIIFVIIALVAASNR